MGPVGGSGWGGGVRSGVGSWERAGEWVDVNEESKLL